MVDPSGPPWYYMFVYATKVSAIDSLLSKRYVTFVHKTTKSFKKGNVIVTKEHPTISGLLFVQGDDPREIQKYLDDNMPGIHLVNDYCNRKVVTICNRDMQAFIQLSKIDGTMVRFMPKKIEYYSVGNTLVKVTSGILSGLSGYVVRIAREKRLVTVIGNMTVAISGIHKETFENADEYAYQRRLQQGLECSPNVTLTKEQQAIDKCFFRVESYIDLMAVAKGVSLWIDKAEFLIGKGDLDRAFGICLFMLEEIGIRLFYEDRTFSNEINSEIGRISHKIRLTAESIYYHPSISKGLHERIETEKLSIRTRYPTLFSLADKYRQENDGDVLPLPENI